MGFLQRFKKANQSQRAWNKNAIGGVLVAALVLAVGATRAITSRSEKLARIQSYNFTLPGSEGNFTLSSERGKVAVLYFGYTSCADFCPLSLAKLASALKGLSAARQEQIVPIFVSVDPRGDTPQKVQKYVSFFFPGGVGLGGSKPQIDSVVEKFGATYTIENDPKTALGYVVNHSTSFFLVGPDGDFAGTVPTDAATEALRTRIKDLL